MILAAIVKNSIVKGKTMTFGAAHCLFVTSRYALECTSSDKVHSSAHHEVTNSELRQKS